MNWKNFDFSFLFSGIAKASRLYAGWGATEFANVGFFSDYHLQAWTPERFANGEEILYPALGSAPGTSQKPNDFFIMDRSFLRLKNIELGYTLPKGLLKKVGINTVSYTHLRLPTNREVYIYEVPDTIKKKKKN